MYSRETAYEIEDYPYGFHLRTSMFIWIEKNKRGMRVCRQTINPKTGRENKPKKSVYYTYIRLYRNEEEHIKTYTFNMYSVQDFLKAKTLGIFEEQDKELMNSLWESQRILSIRGRAIYSWYELEKIKDLTLEQLDKIDKKEDEGDTEYINQYKTEEGKSPDYSPFKTTSYAIG